MSKKMMSKKRAPRPYPLLVSCLLFAAFAPLHADTFTFKADRMSGGRASGSEITILQGNAQVQSGTLFIQAERIEISGSDNQFVTCRGGVSGYDTERGITFTTDLLNYDRELKIAKLEGDSKLKDTENNIEAEARFIEYDQESEVALLQVAVRLFRESEDSRLECMANYAVYSRTDKMLNLSGFPLVYRGESEFRADRIQVNVETENVQMEGGVSGSIKEGS
jgi:lipopolysaccharide export system protein LptA